MRSLVIFFRPEGELQLPLAHFEALQGLAYRLLAFDPAYSAFLHDRQTQGQATYKFFCFSDIAGRCRAADGTLTYAGELRWELRAAEDKTVEVLSAALCAAPSFSLGDCRCAVQKTEVAEARFFGPSLSFSLGTPMVAYESTPDRHTRFYSPESWQFYEIAEGNLLKKYRALFGRDYEGMLDFACPRPAAAKKCVTRFKGIYITGYYGEYTLTARPDMLALAWHTGVGGKNSMGFGFPRPAARA